MKTMIFAAMLAALPLAAQAQMSPPAPAPAAALDYSNVEEQVTELGHNMYALTGAGGNTTIAVGRDGIIMVDTQFAPLHDKLKAKIASLSLLPIKYVVNTHYHGDHTGGNSGFARDGALLVAHQAVAQRMSQANPPLAPDAVPIKTYAGKQSTVAVTGVVAQLVHPAPAHTDGDTIVIWRAANVISTGDIVSSASYPNIDVASGGSIGGMIAGTDYVIAHANAATRIVPGHGPVTDKAGVIAYRAMLVAARDRIARAKASGMSEDQVANANLLADLDGKWKPQGSPMAARFPRLVYQSVP